MKRINKLFAGLLLVFLPCAGTIAQQRADSFATDRSYFSVRSGLAGFYTRVAGQKTATVGFLGGSITFNPGWRDSVCAYLRSRFPETDFRFIAAGIPSLGSLPHAFRVQRDLLDSGRIDLLFLETAVNDRVNGTDSLTQVRALEGIIRHVKTVNPSVSIIMMAFADEDKTADYDRGRTPAETTNQERMAGYYQLSSINLGKEVWDRIAHGELDWKRDFKDVHPSEFGQQLYFLTIRRLLDSSYRLYRAVLESAKRSAAPPPAAPPPAGSPPAAAPSAAALPVALDRACLANGRYADVHGAVYDKKWRIDEDWKPRGRAKTRPGFVHVPVLAAKKKGAGLSFSFKGPAVGIAVVSGPDAGIIDYSIDGQPFQSVNLYTKWSKGLHLPWYLLLGSGLTATDHTLQIRISDGKDPKSKGHACRIVHFLVNE